MITKDYLEEFNSPIRKITGKAEVYTASASTKSGENLTLNDVSPIRHNIKANIKSKNLIPYPFYATTQTNAGITFTDNRDGTLTLNGTSTGVAFFTLCNNVNALGISVGKTYSIYSSKNGAIVRVLFSGVVSCNDTTFTVTEKMMNESAAIRCDIRIPAGLTFDNVTLYPMLTEGTTEETFTPYVKTNGAEVEVTGENLFNIPNTDFSKNVSVYTLNSKKINANYKENTQYCFSWKSTFISGTEGIALYARIHYTDGTNNGYNGIVARSSDNNTIKTVVSAQGKTVKAITFLYSVNAIYQFTEIMLTEGNEKKAYIPYRSNTYTADENGNIDNIVSFSPIMNFTKPIGAIITATYNAITKTDTYNYNDALQSITIDRASEQGKFFGFGVSQKATIKLRDKNREINLSKGDMFKTLFNINAREYVNIYPDFYISETNRNENTNDLTVIAEDMLFAAARHSVSELGLTDYTIRDFTEACASFLGLKLAIVGLEDTSCFDTEYAEGANFDGSETIAEALKAVAEATQTIFYISTDTLVFRRLGAAAADLAIEKKGYYTLKNKDTQTLSAICHATELGDNVISSSIGNGVTQYVRDNPFWELRDDVNTLVDNAISAIGGLEISQYELSWRGNFLNEPGDKIEVTTKDGGLLTSYLFNDTITYNGGFKQKSQWDYKAQETTSANPSTIGEAIKQTYAKVDKVNKQVDIVVSETNANKEDISALQINTNSINASVSRMEQDIKDNQDATSKEINALKSKVNMQITPEDVTISIQKEMANGVDKVITATTGYKFDDDGLDITKSDSEVSTKITHEGMTVAAAGDEVLTANHEGVKAVDLHATTYLIIGKYSRFEDYDGRTGCFWLGGNS